MARFFDADDGTAMNLDLVTHVTRTYDAELKTIRHEFFAVNGKMVGTICLERNVPLDGYTAQVVAAPAGTEAVLVTLPPYSGVPLTRESLKLDRVPITAWRLDGTYSHPVYLEWPSSRQLELIALSDGRFLSQGEGTFPNLEAAIESILTQARIEMGDDIAAHDEAEG